MSSFRAKYRDKMNGHANGAAKDMRPVATGPRGADAPPAEDIKVKDEDIAIEAPKPAEPDNPAEDAAKNFMRDRINEIANAEALVRQQLKAPQPQQSEAPQQETQSTLEAFLEKLPEQPNDSCELIHSI